MAIYRTIQLSFWTDRKVADEFTPEDKFFYLYLLTNPGTNICGCYEISMSQFTNQTGYNKETISRLLKRFDEVHNVIKYSEETREVLLLNWHTYNWNTSEKVLKAIRKQIEYVKYPYFKRFLSDVADKYESGDDRVCIPYEYPMDTSVYVTVTDTVNNNLLNTSSNNNKVKHKYGEYSNVLLTDEEYEKLKERFPDDWQERIENLSIGIASKGYKYKSHYATILNWARRENKQPPSQNSKNEYEEIEKRLLGGG